MEGERREGYDTGTVVREGRGEGKDQLEVIGSA
jgi:hypothetical protein